ncbi:PD40 domain-containing protein [Nocardioides gansuensis]|uniref:PD40 domain-containing protein n=1 Tax=Nocardioides gansuensis TaxID=2138300 RepID=UPI001403ABFC|nr:PD40 domain-containing protein [Nocardioides gansuensis]
MGHTDDWPRVVDSSWSPDGTWIALTRVSSEKDAEYVNATQLFRVRPDGSRLAAIPNTEPFAVSPAWSPDGTTILYTEVYGGRGGEFSGGLWSIRPDGTGKTQVTRSKGNEGSPSWSPDGRRVAMQSDGALYTDKAGIWTVNPDGTHAQFVVREGSRPSWRPSWRPSSAPDPTPAVVPASDGPRIAYFAASEAGFDLFTVRPDGRRVRQLTSSGHVVEVTWSPDHSQIAYATHDWFGYPGVAWVMDVRTLKTERVGRSFAEGPLGALTWSPDGRRLAWGTYESLMIVDLRSRERTRIPRTGNGCIFLGPSRSPDGKWIAFSGGKSCDLMIVPSRGGDPARDADPWRRERLRLVTRRSTTRIHPLAGTLPRRDRRLDHPA